MVFTAATNETGLILIAFSILLLIAEAFSATGILALGGIVAFVLGSALLWNSGANLYHLSWPLVLSVIVATLAFLVLAITLAIRAKSRPIVSGQEKIIGSVGEIERIDESGMWLRLGGELWQVHSSQSLTLGQKVVVINREGLVLSVTPK